MQTGADPGTLGVELEAGTNFRLVVHQATGMVAEQLGISVTEALIRLRAHAFTQDRTAHRRRQRRGRRTAPLRGSARRPAGP